MHGTAEAFEKLNAHLAAQMRPLAEKLDAFAANGSRALGREEILGLQRDMATMKNAFASVRANGIEVQGGRIEVDKSLLDEMERVLSDAAERIANAREIAVKRTRGAFLEELKAALSPENAPGGDKAMASSRYAGHPVLVEFRKARKDLVELIRDFAVGALPMDQFDARFNPCITKFRIGLFDNLELALLEVGFDAAASKQVAKTVRGLDYVKAQFKELMKSTEALRTGGEDPALATGDVRRLLLGENSLSSLVEAKARGFKPGDVDPAADDSNVVESKTLGSGAAGTTYLLTTKSGEKLVFKPELDSRIGLGDLMLGKGKAYLNAQQTANLNLATQDTARAFGCEDVVVKYSVGSHNGQFGIFMEKAKGIPGSGFTRRSASGGGGIPPAELHRIADPAEQAKIKGAIARKLNQLMWLDLVTGQGDRHWGNYFVHIDRATHEVTVKGIDNDASFSALRIGLMKFSLNKRQTSLFQAQLKNACQKIHGKGWEAEYNRCLNDPAIVRNGDTLTIDLAKAKSPEAKMAIIPTVGLQTIALPEEIDQDFYDHLLAMDGDTAARRAFLGSIAPRISPDALKAAEARLDEAIAHAKALKAKGKVYGTDQWQNQKNIGADLPVVLQARILPQYVQQAQAIGIEQGDRHGQRHRSRARGGHRGTPGRPRRNRIRRGTGALRRRTRHPEPRLRVRVGRAGARDALPPALRAPPVGRGVAEGGRRGDRRGDPDGHPAAVDGRAAGRGGADRSRLRRPRPDLRGLRRGRRDRGLGRRLGPARASPRDRPRRRHGRRLRHLALARASTHFGRRAGHLGR